MAQLIALLRGKTFQVLLGSFVFICISAFSCRAPEVDALCSYKILTPNYLNTEVTGVAIPAGSASSGRYAGTCGVKRNADRQTVEARLLGKSLNSNPAGDRRLLKNPIVVFNPGQANHAPGNPCKGAATWTPSSYMHLRAICKFTNPPGTVFRGGVTYEAEYKPSGFGRQTFRLPMMNSSVAVSP